MMTSTTIDLNTKVNIGALVTILGLGVGGIWKVAGITQEIAVGNTKLTSIEEKVTDLSESVKLYVPRVEIDARFHAVERRVDRNEVSIEEMKRHMIGGNHGVGGK